MPTVTLETGQKLTFPEGTTSDQIHFAVDEFVTKNGISPQEVLAQQAPAALQQAAQKPQSFQEQIKPYRRSASEDAKTMISALYSGAEDLGTGIYQAAADLGFDSSGAKKVLSMVRPDLREQIQSLTSEDISQVLADKQKAKNASEADKPLGFKAIKEITKIIPFLASGSTTGKLVSEGVASLGTAAKAVAPIVGLSARGVVGGATSSALSPQEEAGLGNRALETAKGAAIAAILTPLIGRTISLVGAGIGKGTSAVKNLFNKKTAEEVTKQAIPPEVAAKALDQLKLSPKGQPTTALDIDLPEFQNLIKTTISKHPQSKQIAAEFAAGRKEEAAARVSNILSKDISPVEDYFSNYAKKRTAQKAFGFMNYDKAYSFIPKTKVDEEVLNNKPSFDSFGGYIFKDKQLDNLITTRPNFTRKAAKEASDLFQIEHGITIDPNDLLNPSTRNVDMLKKGLDVLIDKETNGVTGKITAKGRQLNMYKDSLVNRIDKLNPDYKKARNIYAGDFAVQKSQQLGRKFDKLSPEELKIELNKLGQSEINAFRVGQRLRMQELADKSNAPAEKIFTSQHIQKQLKASFKEDETRYNEFAQKMKEEISYNKTIKNYGLDKHEVETNPNILSKLIGTVASVATGSKVTFQGAHAVKTALINHYDGLNAKNAEELTRIFINKKSSINLLENIVKKSGEDQKPLVQKAINDNYPIILSNILGNNSIDKPSIVSDANAEDETNLTEEEIRAQLIKVNNQRKAKGYRPAYSEEEIQNNPSLIKNRYYR